MFPAPMLVPVTTPAASTVTLAGNSHVIGAAITRPNWSRAVAVSVAVPPVINDMAVGATDIDVNTCVAGAVTVIVAVLLIVPLVAVIVAVPADTPVTTPVVLTVATASLLVVQSIAGCAAIGAPSWSRPEAVSVVVAPAITEAVVGVTTMLVSTRGLTVTVRVAVVVRLPSNALTVKVAVPIVSGNAVTGVHEITPVAGLMTALASFPMFEVGVMEYVIGSA